MDGSAVSLTFFLIPTIFLIACFASLWWSIHSVWLCCRLCTLSKIYTRCVCHACMPEYRILLIVDNQETMLFYARLYYTILSKKPENRYTICINASIFHLSLDRPPLRHLQALPDGRHDFGCLYQLHWIAYVLQSQGSATITAGLSVHFSQANHPCHTKLAGCTLCNSIRSSGCWQYTALDIWWGQQRLSPWTKSSNNSVHESSDRDTSLWNLRRSNARESTNSSVSHFIDPELPETRSSYQSRSQAGWHALLSETQRIISVLGTWSLVCKDPV